jgi:hypothetical protein
VEKVSKCGGTRKRAVHLRSTAYTAGRRGAGHATRSLCASRAFGAPGGVSRRLAKDEMRPLCEPPKLLKDPWDPLRESKLRERERGESPGIESPARMPSGLYP